MAADALAAGDVVEILAGIRPPADPINAVYASSRNLPGRMRAFIAFLADLPGLKRRGRRS